MLDPIAVALKFGFLAVLYLFLLWVARSALRDLRRTAEQLDARAEGGGGYEPGTGVYQADAGLGGADGLVGPALLRVESAPGLSQGAVFDVSTGATLGRSDRADIRLEDTFASSRHARLEPHGELVVLEDLGSTNGTFLNGEPLRGPQPLHPGDRIRIGDSEFSFDR